MVGVVNYGKIGLQFLDRRVFEHSFRLECKQRVSAAQVFRALDEVINEVDIIEIGRTDSLSWNLVIGGDEAAKVLRDLGLVEVGGRYCRVVPVSHQEVEIRCHWLPSYIKDEFLKYIFSDYGRVKEVRRETTVLGANLERRNGVRVVVLETDDMVKGNIPHLIRFEGQMAMLITMPGRPPLCLRCNTVGHVRRDCTVNTNYRQPQQRRTYAAAAAAAPAPVHENVNEKETVVEKPEEEETDEIVVMEEGTTNGLTVTKDEATESTTSGKIEIEGDMESVPSGDQPDKDVQQGVRRRWDDSEGFDLAAAGQGQLFIDYAEDESSAKRTKTVTTFELMCGTKD